MRESEDDPFRDRPSSQYEPHSECAGPGPLEEPVDHNQWEDLQHEKQEQAPCCDRCRFDGR